MKRRRGDVIEDPRPGMDHPHAQDGELDAAHGTRTREARWDAGVDEDVDRTIELREEERLAHKEVVLVGGVLFRKEVSSEPRSIAVPIVRQGVVVEHYPVDRHPAAGPIGKSRVIRVPVLAEHVTIEKRPVVIEEVRVGRHAVQAKQRISETVQREEVVLDAQGSARVEKRALL